MKRRYEEEEEEEEEEEIQERGNLRRGKSQKKHTGKHAWLHMFNKMDHKFLGEVHFNIFKQA